jgi:hypothetical protein
MFHPWRREANLKCVVSIDTSSLHDKFCASWAQPKGPCLSRSACWLPNLVVTASTVVHCMTTDMPRAAVKGSTIFFVPKTSTAPPFFPWPAWRQNSQIAVPKRRFRRSWCPSIASQGTRPSSTSLCPIWHRWLVIWTSNAAIIIV